MELNCKGCGKKLIQSEGKREKSFCSDSCRSNFWQKEARRKKRELKKLTASGEENEISAILKSKDAEIERLKKRILELEIPKHDRMMDEIERVRSPQMEMKKAKIWTYNS